MTGSVSASSVSAAETAERATSADAQTHKQQPPPVRGPTSNDSENECVVGKRIRKSFGSRFFWGSVVGCYYIAGAPFYKISFDDGDVDILAAAEVLEDVKQARRTNAQSVCAEKHAAEDTSVACPSLAAAHESADVVAATLDPSQQPSYAQRYQDELRQATLKRKRGESEPVKEPQAVIDTYNMEVWGERLYLSIVTNKRVTTVAEFMRRGDGSVGEVEATGKVKIGDVISHINGVPLAGMDSGAVSDRIKISGRPMQITLQRPRPRSCVSFSGTTGAVACEKTQEEGGRSLETDAVRVTDPTTGAEAAQRHTSAPPASNHVHAPARVPSSSNPPTVAPPPYRILELSAHTAAHVPVAAPNSSIPASQPDSVAPAHDPPQYPEQQQQQPRQHDPARQSVFRPGSTPAYSNNNSNSNLHFAQQPERQSSPMQHHQHHDSTQQFAPTPASRNNSNTRIAHQSANQAPMQQYRARPHQQPTQQGYGMASHPSVPTNTPFGQQPRGAMPNANAHAWNNPPYRSGQPVRKVGVSLYGMQMMSQPQPTTTSYNLSYAANPAPSYPPRPQHPPPQAAAAGGGGGSHHSTAMLTQYPQQAPRSTWWQSGNGNQTVVSNSSVSSSGSNAPNSFLAPSAMTTSGFDNRPRVEHRPIQQPPAAIVEEIAPVQNGPCAWSSSHQSRFESAATEPPSRSFSESESRFSVIEPAQEENDKQQQQHRSEAVNNSATESDEPLSHAERGAFALEGDFEDDEKELVSVLGTDMASFSDPSAAPEASPAAEAMSFLSPNKPSFVSKLPDNLSNRYRQFSSSQYQQQLPFTAGMVTSFNGEDCAVVRIRRSRLYVTLGSLGSRVSITSFVRGRDGEAGEIEESGKVLLGDTIVAINGVPVVAHTSPTEVAHAVISLPRPFELYFQRASWDVLDGKE